MENTRETLASRLTRLRKSRKISQERLSEVTGVPRRTIQNLEYGAVESPHDDTLIPLASFFGLSVHQLLLGEGSLQPTPLTVSDMTPEQLLATLSRATQTETADEAELLRLFRSSPAPLKAAILETVRNLCASDDPK